MHKRNEHPAEAVISKTAERKQAAGKDVGYNLQGQRLGRKGRDTRERIIAAAAELLAGPPDVPVTLSAVARKASLGMTSLYVYFKDLAELILAVLEPITASAEEAYVWHLRERWPDENLRERCVAFVRDYHAFWKQHARVLHMRNSMADAFDSRMAEHRIGTARPLIELIIRQMDGDPSDTESPVAALATALYIGLERLVVVLTDADMPKRINASFLPNQHYRLMAVARMLELSIRHGREGIDFDGSALMMN